MAKTILDKVTDMMLPAQVVNLECDTCGKVCGNVSFPASENVDLKVVQEKYQVDCGEH